MFTCRTRTGLSHVKTRTNVTSKPPRIESSENDNKYYCDICPDSYDSETEVEIHRKTTHNHILEDILLDSEQHPCKICIQKMGSLAELIKHTKTVHLLTSAESNKIEKDIFICSYCEKLFFHKGLLEVHIQQTHLKFRDNDILTCPKCCKSIRAKNVWSHFQTHDLQSKRCCPICLSLCLNREAMYEHIKYTHPNNYICSVCGFNTTQYTHYDKHLKNHHNTKSSNRSNIPFKKYYAPQHYKTQMTCDYLKKHYPKGLYIPSLFAICVLCKEICMCQNHMKRHIEVEHAPDDKEDKKKRYMCLCGENFFNMVLLKHHIFKRKGLHAIYDESAQEMNVASEVTVTNAIPATADQVTEMDVTDSHGDSNDDDSSTIILIELCEEDDSDSFVTDKVMTETESSELQEENPNGNTNHCDEKEENNESNDN